MKITNWLQSCRRTLRAFAVGCLSPVGVLSALAGGLLFGAASAQAGNVTIVGGQIMDGGTVVGTATTVGSDMVLQFTEPGSGMIWTVPSGVTKVRYLVVGGGGGGGGGYGGGGGAGGFIEAKNVVVNPNDTYTITVGAGGVGGTGNNYYLETCAGANGGNSLFGSVEAFGGGGGGSYKVFAKDGGSGGGASIDWGSRAAHNPGKGTSGQGNDGGTGYLTTEDKGAGGGGGAGDPGASGELTKSGNGGAGESSDITGSASWYAGGGGGFGNGTMGYGSGTNGGGDGSKTATGDGSAATTPGSGGGGANHTCTGGAGANGVVIIRYQADFNYQVTFNPNGGNTPSPTTKAVTNGGTYGDLATCSRAGYTFAGWWTSAGGGTQVTSATTVNLSANQTLYAHWTPNTYMVTLDKNATDATAGTASVTATYGAAMPSAAMPTREGYVFQGYYDTNAASGGNLYYTGTGASARNWDKTDNTTLYARWAEPVDPGDMPKDWGYVTNYTQNSKNYVAYVYTNPAPETVSVPMTFTVPKGVTSLDYLVVGGGGGGGGTTGGGGGAGGFRTLSDYSVTPGATLTVKVGAGGAGGVGMPGSSSGGTWGGKGGSSQLGTITAQGGGTGGYYKMAGQTAAQIAENMNGASGGGSGWYNGYDGGTGIAGQGNAGGRATNHTGGGGGAGGPGGAGLGSSSDHTGNGGAGAWSDITGLGSWYAGGGGGAGDPTKEGLGSNGGGNGATVADSTPGGDGTTPGSGGGGGYGNPVNSGAEPKGVGGRGADGIVVVRYEEAPQTYTVFFNANGGGTPEPTSKTVTRGQTYGTLATCSRTGYTFNGWYTDASGGTKVETTTTFNLTADQVLYAQWTADNYTITVNQDGGSGGTISQDTYTISEVDQTRTMTANPTRSDYTFAGWTVSSAPTSGTPTISGNTLTIPAGTYGDFTVTATWLQNMAVTAADYTGEYDGNAHGITLTVTTPASGATIRYRTSESGAYDLTTAPTRTDVGTTTVFYQITAPNFVTTTGSKTITITLVRGAVPPTAQDRTYNGSFQDGYSSAGTHVKLTGDMSAKNAGSYTFYAEPDENYAWSDGTYGKKSYTWTMARANTATEPTAQGQTYNGTSQNGYSNAGTGVTLSGTPSATEVNTYTFSAEPDANHTWSNGTTTKKDYTWTISAASISSVTLASTSTTYDGNAHQPSVLKVTANSTDFTADSTGWDVTYKRGSSTTTDFTSAGTITVTVTGKTNLKDSKSVDFTIGQKSISSLALTLSPTSYTYDGNAKQPTGAISGLTAGTDFTMSYSSNVNAGTATATATGKGNYSGTVSKTFTITAATVTIPGTPASKVYNGSTQTADVSGGTGYTVKTNAGGKNVGSYDVVYALSSTTNYKWSDGTTTDKTVKFAITAKEVTLSWGTTTFTYNGSAQKPTCTAGGLVGTDVCTVTVTGEKTNAGTGYTATASSLSNSNYKLPSANTTTFSIAAKAITPSVTLSKTSVTYGDSGWSTLPTVTVKDGTTTLTSGTDYTATWSPETVTGQGAYTVKVTLKGNYSGSQTATYTVGKKAITLTPKHSPITYGDAKPTSGFSYDITSGSLVSGDSLSGTVAYDTAYTQGSAQGTYKITMSGLSNSNYSITFAEGSLTVNKKTVTVTPKASQSKTYGDSDPTLTYDYTPALVGSDKFTGALSRASGETVGTYAISQGTLALSSNYTLTFTTGKTFEIKKRTITINWTNKSFVYDGLAHKPTATAGNVVNSDTVELTVSGEQTEVGSYTATAAFSTTQTNYELPSDKTTTFTITKPVYTVNGDKQIEVDPTEMKKLFGVTVSSWQTELTTANANGVPGWVAYVLGAQTPTEVTDFALNLMGGSGTAADHITLKFMDGSLPDANLRRLATDEKGVSAVKFQLYASATQGGTYEKEGASQEASTYVLDLSGMANNSARFFKVMPVFTFINQ